MDLFDIALTGRTGSGKTTIVSILEKQYGYVPCSTGSACREICKLLFGSESKDLLNAVTDAMKAIDERVWLRAAISGMPEGRPLVLDSLRFNVDHAFAVEQGMRIWRVISPRDVRIDRLADRGQEYDADRDEDHPAETSLESIAVDVVIVNDGATTLVDLEREVRRLVEGR